MADEPDTPAGDDPPKPRRGRPKGSGGGAKTKPPTQRFQRRAENAAKTVKELVRLGMPELDVSELTFAETVDRDADAWGDFLAQLGEWFAPVGVVLDLFFGVGLVRVLNMAPSFRAGRRDLAARAAERRAARQAQLEDAELREVIEHEHAEQPLPPRFAFPFPPAAEDGDEPQPAPTGAPVEEPPHELTREEWLARGGNGGA